MKTKTSNTIHGTQVLTRLAIVLVATSLTAFAQKPAVVTAQVTNVRFTTSPEYVFVYYDLVPEERSDSLSPRSTRTISAPAEYAVRFVVRKETDPEFRYEPKFVAGEIGTGIREGKDRVIRWNIAREFPSGLDGTDYYFVVTAQRLNESSNTMTWIMGTGAALVGGTVLYFILSRPDSQPTTQTGSFPSPPGRP